MTSNVWQNTLSGDEGCCDSIVMDGTVVSVEPVVRSSRYISQSSGDDAADQARDNAGEVSVGLLLVLFVTLISGAVSGFSASLLVDIPGGASALMMAVQMAATIVFAAAVAFVGVLALDMLAGGFEFS